MFYVDKCDKEIGGMGRVKYDKKTDAYTVLSVCLPTQEVGSAHTDLDADSVAKCEIETANDEGWFNFWWHSHVNMQAFWSGTDTATIKEMGERGLCIAVVFNKKRECRGAVYAMSSEDHVPNYFNDNVQVEWEHYPITKEESLAWEDEMRRNIRTKAYNHHAKAYNHHAIESGQWVWCHQSKQLVNKDEYKSKYGTATHGATYYSNANDDDKHSVYLDEDYKAFDEFYRKKGEETRTFTGISNAYKKSTEKTIRLCQRDGRDYMIYQWGNIKLTVNALLAMSRSEVQDVIDGNATMPQAKQIELMSIWYFIPMNTELTNTPSDEPVQTTILQLAGADI